MAENENIKVLISRRSIRNFDDKPIEDEILNQILEAGRWTYSALNRQPWKFYVIRNKELINKVAKECISGPFAANAQVLIVLIADPELQPEWYMLDLSFAALQLTLAAWSFGIGTCFIAFINKDNVKKILGLSEKDYVFTVLPLGYPKGGIPKPTPRKSLEEMVKYFD